MQYFKILFAFSLLFLLAACGNGSDDDPTIAVEAYLQAKVASDDDAIRALLCSDMEQYLERETQTFASVSNASIEEMSCSHTGNGRVACQGAIIALYGSEETVFPLTNYQAVNEDGEWKWCGETR